MTLIKSISGIRGTIGGNPGDNLTPLDIVKFTAAYARWLSDSAGGRTVVVGRDARISGRMVSDIVCSTLCGCGFDVIDTGLNTTPGVEMAVTHFSAAGGIIVTASHNPGQWNALKLLGPAGEFVSAADGARILELAATDDYDFVGIAQLGSISTFEGFDQIHIDKVLALPLVNTDAIRSRGFTVALDAVNSVGGIVIPKLLERLGVRVICVNCTPDGQFSHNPEPLAENLTDLSLAVTENGADMGIAVDPDVDRLALVCEDGTMFGEEYTLVAAADHVLSKNGGNTVSNLSSTRALRDVTLSHGGSYATSAVGEVNVVEAMKATGAVIGGEGNGGVILPELHYGRDALVGIALVLSLMAEKGVSATALRDSYPAYYISKNKIELGPDTDVDGLLRKFASLFPQDSVNTVDGVKIDQPDHWIHLRRSNTEPIIRIYVEAADRQTADGLARTTLDKLAAIAGR